METTPDDFRIKPLREDRDALLLIILAVLLALLVVVGLAFLPDAAWERLQERGRLLWGAALAVAPVLLLAWKRLDLRREAIKALGKAASAPLTIEAPMGELIHGTLETMPGEPAEGEQLPPHDAPPVHRSRRRSQQ